MIRLDLVENFNSMKRPDYLNFVFFYMNRWISLLDLSGLFD